MPLPRKTLISLSDTPYYHCISRCVRRAFLCGRDKLTGQNYEHRRGWVEQRLLLLGKVFAIDICAYAVMSNHTHVVLHVNKEKAALWSSHEVLLRWHRLHRGTVLTRRYLCEQERGMMSTAELSAVQETVEVYRQRLFDISWFMRLLNEFIARRANKEDGCTGRFWEGRFKSQSLLDEAALAACMVYVDLNPVRSKIALSPEKSSHTSIRRRIETAKRGLQPDLLYPLTGNSDKTKAMGLPFSLTEYLQLVRKTGRYIVHGNTGAAVNFINVLTQMGIKQKEWHWLVAGIETRFANKIGVFTLKRKIALQKKCRRD